MTIYVAPDIEIHKYRIIAYFSYDSLKSSGVNKYHLERIRTYAHFHGITKVKSAILLDDGEFIPCAVTASTLEKRMMESVC